jgi:phosphotriesterase-related protein
MSAHSDARKGNVMTVEGLIASHEMGITLPHEHLIVQGWDFRDPNYFYSAYLELEPYVLAGGKTLVDLTPIGRDRDVSFIRRLSQKAGIQLVLGTGYYKEAWLPPEMREMSVQQLSQVMVMEFEEGIGDTNIKAGVIGEIGLGIPISFTERKVLEACAIVQQETGAAVFLHFDPGVEEHDYRQALNVLETEGVDLGRVVVSHLIPRPDNLELIVELAGRGCYVGFDLFCQERWPLANDLIDTHPDVQISSVRGFIDYGLLDKILISQNVCHVTHLTVNGGLGYGHVLKIVVPRFRTYGISDRQIQTMMVDNPARLIPFR